MKIQDKVIKDIKVYLYIIMDNFGKIYKCFLSRYLKRISA